MTSLKVEGKEYTARALATASLSTDFGLKIQQVVRWWLSTATTYTIQTSGSTGQPKTITLTRPQMVASAQATLKALSLPEHSTLLLCLSPEYIGGVMMIIRALAGNHNLEAIDPTSNLKSLNTSIDMAAMVPLQLYNIYHSNEGSKLDLIKCILLGGAPVSLSTQLIIKSVSPNIYATYGMTETTSHIALKRLNKQPEQYFKTLPGVVIATDKRNCLIINGPMTNNEQVITNDVVELKDNQHFNWVGRIDHVINSGGIKIQSEQLEDKIGRIFLQNNLTNRFFIAGTPDEKYGEKVVLILEGLSVPDQEGIKKMISPHLERYHIPKVILFSEAFSETPSGKVLRNETLKRALESH